MGIGLYHRVMNYLPIFKSKVEGVEKTDNNVQPSSVKLHELKQDTFEKSPEIKSPVLDELNKIFPNGEIYKIFDNIVNEYGLENIPKLKLVTNSANLDFAFTSPISNSVTLNLDNILTDNIYKFLVEKDGKKSYCMNKMTGSLRTLKTDNQDEINEIIEGNKSLGAESCTAEHLSDDDKRKIIIFSLAHELEHCYQNQLIRKTEGLDEFEMIKTALKRNPNTPKLNEKEESDLYKNLKDKYYANHDEKSLEKVYSADSPEGRQAKEWYNASINYTDCSKDYDSYAANPLEVDANTRAHEYLEKYYGDFKSELN